MSRWGRIAVFFALAAFAAAHWLGLLTDPPAGRAALALAAIVAGALLLASIEAAGIGGWRRGALALPTVLIMTAAALVAIGLPASMLFPDGWDELGAGVDRGLGGLGGEIEFPYAGGEEWSRLILLLGLVCALALAAALAFWPRRPAGSGARISGLVVLVGIYAASAAMKPGTESVLVGLALVVLVAAWLWLPGLAPRRAILAGAAVLALGALALPLAASLEARPWVDYRDWRLASPTSPRSFQWDHSYGPLLPRAGRPMLEVGSDAPRYWRAAVLDEFNGYTWERSARDVGQPPLELPTRVDPEPRAAASVRGRDGRASPARPVPRLNPEWVVTTEFKLRELESEFAIAPGALRTADIALDPTPNGTTIADDGALTEGDTYTSRSYAPDPSPAEMRRAPDAYAPALSHHTTIQLPRRYEPSAERPLFNPPIVVPLRGGTAAGEERVARLEGTPYGEVRDLARRLTAEAGTTYDAVKSIEFHLQRNYDYVEGVSPRKLALHSFLFEDREGYCEQFSGSMALMLRTLGIPSRVATGFTPGSPDPERPGRYLVRDLDAHSWVEVYFTGIGWVPFDPTPGAAPAALQPGDLVAAGAGGTDGAEEEPPREARAAASGADGGSGSSSLPLWPFAAGLGALLLAAIALTAARLLRDRSLAPDAAAEARIRELESALARLDWRLPAGTTLLSLERVLRSARRPAAASYAAGLRGQRFCGNGARLPSRSERRRMRRELAGARGRLTPAPLRAYRAIPPGAPRRRG